MKCSGFAPAPDRTQRFTANAREVYAGVMMVVMMMPVVMVGSGEGSRGKDKDEQGSSGDLLHGMNLARALVETGSAVAESNQEKDA